MRDLNFKAIVIDLEIVALVVALVVAVVVAVVFVVACVSFSCLRRKLLASVGSLDLRNALNAPLCADRRTPWQRVNSVTQPIQERRGPTHTKTSSGVDCVANLTFDVG